MEGKYFPLLKVISEKELQMFFGNKIEEKLIPVEEMTSFASFEEFVVKPEFAKKSRSQQFFFVNRRFIKSFPAPRYMLLTFEV